MIRHNYHRIQNSAGFTLIEVLVALLIVALGMLGNAMLQLQGMKNSNAAYLRSQIGIIAYDIADKIRANRECQNQYLAQGTLTVANPYVVGTTALGVCNPAGASGLAGFGAPSNEMRCIGQILDAGLPQAAQVALSSQAIVAAGASRAVQLFRLRVSWVDRSNNQQNVDYTFDPGACAVAAACNCI